MTFRLSIDLGSLILSLMRCHGCQTATSPTHCHIYTEVKSPIITGLQVENMVQVELLRMHQLALASKFQPPFPVQRGLILYQRTMFLLADFHLVPKVLWEFHESPQGGHTGALKMFKRVAEQIFWFGMQKQIQ